MRQFRKLVETHQQRIYGFAWYFMGNREDAEEITQDVLLSIWRSSHEVKPDGLTAWVMRVTRNACLDAIRKRRSYEERVTPEKEDMRLEETVADTDDPGARFADKEFRKHVEDALCKLAEPYRTVVILREIQDMTYEEITETTEMPMNTVKTYIHRGRRMLRDHLREIMDDEHS